MGMERTNMRVSTISRGSWLVVAVLGAATCVTGTAFGDGKSDRITGALTGGKVSFDLRYRYERVDQDGDPRNAEASTARLRLGYTTGTYRGLSALAEFEGTWHVGADTYDSTANGRTDYPVVADPEDSELNQAYLAYQGPRSFVIKLGRQRIKLDNSRFIGNVGWRQNEQTFDAVTFVGKLTDKTRLTLAYLNNVNRIFGEHHPDSSLADLDVAVPLIHVSHEFPCGTLTGYAHFLEIEDAPATSHRNVGLRFTGRRELSDELDLLYAAEYADQSDYEDAPSSVDAEYQWLEVGVRFRKYTVQLGYEVLGGDGTYGFATPLATLHAFNGWTDKFLTTPADGLEDLYVLAARNVKRWKLAGVYHDFSADNGSADYGDELGFLATRKFKEHYGVGFKYATYGADDYVTDTDKLWVWLQAQR
jgi:hypothetical protein